MRSTWKVKVLGAAASLVLVPQLAAADSIEDQLEMMQQRMSQLEDQLQATNDDLQAANVRVEEQQVVLEEAGIGEDGAVSALSSFLTDTDFYGWVNASYTQGLRGDSDSTLGQNTGGGSFLYKQNNMGFAVNQVWFGMDHASTEESRAGFHIDMLFGTDGGNGTVGNISPSFGGQSSDNSFELFTAYVSYLAPIGNGLMFQGGKLPTLIGAEVVQTNANFNITRGILWGQQPVNNVGLTVGTELGAGFSATVGVLNDSFGSGSVDNNLDKSVTAQVKWESDMVSVLTGVNWGTDNVGNAFNGFDNTGSSTGIADLIVYVNPLDSLQLYVNYDYKWNHTRGGTDAPDIHGVSVAGRFGITDNTGIAARGEYLAIMSGNPDAWSVTGTVDHRLTDNLLIRAEYRYDGNTSAVFYGANSNVSAPPGTPRIGNHKDQHVFIVDATYEF